MIIQHNNSKRVSGCGGIRTAVIPKEWQKELKIKSNPIVIPPIHNAESKTRQKTRWLHSVTMWQSDYVDIHIFHGIARKTKRRRNKITDYRWLTQHKWIKMTRVGGRARMSPINHIKFRDRKISPKWHRYPVNLASFYQIPFPRLFSLPRHNKFSNYGILLLYLCLFGTGVNKVIR